MANDMIRIEVAYAKPERQLILALEVEPGIWCGERTTAIDSVCLYVPRGRGAFASVACMLGVPARIAGVARIVMCTPPGPEGEIDAATLYAAEQIGNPFGGGELPVSVGRLTLRCGHVPGPGRRAWG